MSISKDKCIGCRDDFYNGKNPLGVKECWMRKSAKMVKRFAIGTWSRPADPYAFTEVKVPGCYNQEGLHYYKELPDFVDRKKVAKG